MQLSRREKSAADIDDHHIDYLFPQNGGLLRNKIINLYAQKDGQGSQYIRYLAHLLYNFA